MFGIVAAESIRVAGDRLNDAVSHYVRRLHNLVIGERTAEELKIAIGAAIPLEEDESTSVRGRDQLTGLPRTVIVHASEVTQAIQEHLGSIVQTVRSVLERTPPELASDVIDHGIVLTGGGARCRPPRASTPAALGSTCRTRGMFPYTTYTGCALPSPYLFPWR